MTNIFPLNAPLHLPLEIPVPGAGAMRDLGRSLAAYLGAGDLVILSGPLGAGKTTLTKGIADGLGVRGPVTSPTFVIARVHPPLRPADGGLAAAGPSLVHADAYRLGSSLELDDLDLDADLARSVTVVEWGEGRAEALSGDRLEILISRGSGNGSRDGDDGDTPRVVKITGVGSRWQDAQKPHAKAANRL
jgi:tRNA threonylcarbamoyladenosine biosynthesis protein TsaE